MVQSKRTDASGASAGSLIEIRLSPAKIRDIDRWAEHNNVTRSEAIRRLLRSALAAFRAATKLRLVRQDNTKRNQKQRRKAQHRRVSTRIHR
jgi:metal-responsive CopG/Arc/MetJ family transcriptional regulator